MPGHGLIVVLLLAGAQPHMSHDVRLGPPPAAFIVAPPLRVGRDIAPPRKIHDVPAVPPGDARQIRGQVFIDIIITFDGSVREARVLRGVPMLNQAALDAVKQWRYAQSTMRGKRVEVEMSVTVTFGPPPQAKSPPAGRRT